MLETGLEPSSSVTWMGVDHKTSTSACLKAQVRPRPRADFLLIFSVSKTFCVINEMTLFLVCRHFLARWTRWRPQNLALR